GWAGRVEQRTHGDVRSAAPARNATTAVRNDEQAAFCVHTESVLVVVATAPRAARRRPRQLVRCAGFDSVRHGDNLSEPAGTVHCPGQLRLPNGSTRGGGRGGGVGATLGAA